MAYLFINGIFLLLPLYTKKMKREKTVQLNEITISSAKQLDKVSHVDEDLVIFDEIAYLPLPKEPRRVGCMIFALCLK